MKYRYGDIIHRYNLLSAFSVCLSVLPLLSFQRMRYYSRLALHAYSCFALPFLREGMLNLVMDHLFILKRNCYSNL